MKCHNIFRYSMNNIMFYTTISCNTIIEFIKKFILCNAIKFEIIIHLFDQLILKKAL